jgi:hypothetical protein
MAMHDDIFVANIDDIEDIYRVAIPYHKFDEMRMRMKRRIKKRMNNT